MKLDSFSNGSITFVNKSKSKPATSETKDSVTVHTPEKFGYPAHFIVKHTINATLDVDGAQASQMFFSECVVPTDKGATPYSEVEDAAAHQVAQNLRQLADLIEEAVAKTDKATPD